MVWPKYMKEEEAENASVKRSDKMKTENWPLVLEILEVTGKLDKYVFVGVVEV